MKLNRSEGRVLAMKCIKQQQNAFLSSIKSNEEILKEPRTPPSDEKLRK
jgi:hypothetical protein